VLIQVSYGTARLILESCGKVHQPANTIALLTQLTTLRGEHRRFWRATKTQGGDIGDWRDDFLYLAIAPSAPAKTVADVLDAIWAAGYRKVALLARPLTPPRLPSVVDRPRFEKLRAELAKLSLEKRASHFNDLMEKTLKPCASAYAVWESMSGASPLERIKAIRDRMPAALVKCGCKVKYTEILVLLHYMTVPKPADILAEVVVDLTPKEAGIKTRPTTPWRQLASKAFTRRGTGCG
jgi:hypothetical protein